MLIHSTGQGLVNSLINKLPFEAHIPGYNFCGPGTKLQKRLARGDLGINQLDDACREHDIAYSKSRNLEDRHKADKILEEKAWQRVKSQNAKFGEKSAAWMITNTMKAKRKLGMGCSKRKNRKKSSRKTRGKRKGKVSFQKAVLQKVKSELVKHGGETNITKLATVALKTARAAVKKAGGKKHITLPRFIPLPKVGGLIPFLLPALAGLSALMGAAGGVANIVKSYKSTTNAQKALDENERHNKSMEAIALGKQKTGTGLYLKKDHSGFGLYLRKSKN